MTVQQPTAGTVPSFGAALRRLGTPVLLVTVLLAGCTRGSATSTKGSVSGPPRSLAQTYDSGSPYHLTFDYPGSWTAQEYDEVSSFSTLIVYLSNQPMVTPCRTTSSGPAGATFSTECGLAVEHLGPAGVLAWWSLDSSPGWSFDTDARGGPLTVGGHRAALSLAMTPQCRGIGAEGAMTVVVEDSRVPDNWLEFDACLRGPRLSTAGAQVRALLASARFGRAA